MMFAVSMVFATVSCDDSSSSSSSSLGSTAAACTTATANKVSALGLTAAQLTAYSIADASEMAYDANRSHIYIPDGTNNMDGHYRTDIELNGLDRHPACSRHDVYYDSTNTDNRENYYKWEQFFSFYSTAAGDLWTPSNTTFICAAKKYQGMTLPTGLPDARGDSTEVAEDSSKDIILLLHGNSITVHTWEKYDIQPESLFFTLVCGLSSFPCSDIEGYGGTPDTDGNERDMLAERLSAAGHVVIAADARQDRISSGADGNTTGIDANSGYYTPTNDDAGAAFAGGEGTTLNGGTGLQIHYDPNADSAFKTYHNDNHNFDHGWGVPIYQATLKAVIEEYATSLTYSGANTRKIVIIGHSYGVSAGRDAMRRMFYNYLNDNANNYNPFAVVGKFIGLSGSTHGVSTYDGDEPASQYGMKYCEQIANMKGKIVCEMGSRANFQETYFTTVLNGPERLFETPCADGLFAYGRGQNTGVAPNGVVTCGDAKLGIVQNTIEYWTITMEDYEDGTQQDKYISEDSSKIGALGDMETACANNKTITTSDYDTSLYLLGVNHFGSQRSEAGMNMIERIINGTETKTE